MRFRFGLVSGFALGYYLGARAGRERYEQLNDWLRRLRGSDTVETATEKAKAVLDLGVERARDLVDRGGDEGDPTTVVVASEPLNGRDVANSGLPTRGAYE